MEDKRKGIRHEIIAVLQREAETELYSQFNLAKGEEGAGKGK